jgi:hypothetical protein
MAAFDGELALDVDGAMDALDAGVGDSAEGLVLAGEVEEAGFAAPQAMRIVARPRHPTIAMNLLMFPP